MGVSGFGHKIPSPASVFTTLRHIAEVVQPPARCLILTDSLSSIKELNCLGKLRIRLTLWCINVNNCAGACARTDLSRGPSHVGLVGNKLVDERATLAGFIFDRPLSSNDFQSLARLALMRAWQAKWDSANTGRLAHSIFPNVTLRPWFEGQKEKRSFVCTVSRVLSGHLDIALFDRISVDFE
jgi:hypothetical protein